MCTMRERGYSCWINIRSDKTSVEVGKGQKRKKQEEADEEADGLPQSSKVCVEYGMLHNLGRGGLDGRPEAMSLEGGPVC